MIIFLLEGGGAPLKNSEEKKNLTASVLALSPVFGAGIGSVIGVFFPDYLALAITLGAGFGISFGTVIYAILIGKEK